MWRTAAGFLGWTGECSGGEEEHHHHTDMVLAVELAEGICPAWFLWGSLLCPAHSTRCWLTMPGSCGLGAISQLSSQQRAAGALILQESGQALLGIGTAGASSCCLWGNKAKFSAQLRLMGCFSLAEGVLPFRSLFQESLSKGFTALDWNPESLQDGNNEASRVTVWINSSQWCALEQCLARGRLEAKQFGGSFIAGVCCKGYPKENSARGSGSTAGWGMWRNRVLIMALLMVV